ncbi:hypothetical protein K6L59_03805, partial [Candidatus Phytoplasma sp. Tabriz.2]|nr:hypothetical protein [Candidatus Phytoplasma australiense]
NKLAVAIIIGRDGDSNVLKLPNFNFNKNYIYIYIYIYFLEMMVEVNMFARVNIIIFIIN